MRTRRTGIKARLRLEPQYMPVPIESIPIDRLQHYRHVFLIRGKSQVDGLLRRSIDPATVMAYLLPIDQFL